MSPETIENRVDHLERRMTELEKLPDRITAVESQIVQLRAEMRGEFSAVRTEIGETRHSLRQEIAATGQSLRQEIAATEQSLRQEIADTRQTLQGQIADTRQALQEEVRDASRREAEQNEETRRYMRVLHDDVIARIASIQEGHSHRPQDK